MSETLQSMKNAVQGEGGGLQSVSAAAGEVLAGNSDTRGSSGKKADEASKSISEMSKGGQPGQTTSGTNVGAADQVINQQTGSADHLELGMRKQT